MRIINSLFTSDWIYESLESYIIFFFHRMVNVCMNYGRGLLTNTCHPQLMKVTKVVYFEDRCRINLFSSFKGLM